MDSLQPWNHYDQFGMRPWNMRPFWPWNSSNHFGDAAMDSLQPFWPRGYWITFGHGGHGIAAANLPATMRSLRPIWPYDHGITFGHGGHGFAAAILAILAMGSLQPFWPCGHGIATANLPMRPWDRCSHFGHGIAAANLAM